MRLGDESMRAGKLDEWKNCHFGLTKPGASLNRSSAQGSDTSADEHRRRPRNNTKLVNVQN